MNLFDIIRLNVEFFFEDVEEIGSSDVSCCVNAVINDYAPLTEQYASCLLYTSPSPRDS